MSGCERKREWDACLFAKMKELLRNDIVFEEKS